MSFTINDILVNWDKIKMGMPTVNQTSDDRVPEISEVDSLLLKNNNKIFNINSPIFLIKIFEATSFIYCQYVVYNIISLFLDFMNVFLNYC